MDRHRRREATTRGGFRCASSRSRWQFRRRSLLRLIAGAALPQKGAFAGKTSLRPINGFTDLVTFNACPRGKTLKKFTFGTLGCFGSGAFPVGTDPYGDPEATATVKSDHRDPQGHLPVTTKPVLPGPEHDDDGGHPGRLHEPEDGQPGRSRSRRASTATCAARRR